MKNPGNFLFLAAMIIAFFITSASCHERLSVDSADRHSGSEPQSRYADPEIEVQVEEEVIDNDEAERAAPPVHNEVAFAHKLIFSDTPRMGRKWRGGIRSRDIFMWDMYFNFGDIVLMDIVYAGIPQEFIRALAEDTNITFTDNMVLLTLKSRPLTISLPFADYDLAGGLKAYGSKFHVSTQDDGPLFEEEDGAVSIFAVQSMTFSERSILNIYSSLAFRSHEIGNGEQRLSATYYLIPGAKVFIGGKKRWSFNTELYLMNPLELPIKSFQLALDEDNNEFYNIGRDIVTFVFYGFSYARRNFTIDLYFGNHPSFSPPYIPFFGFGWNF
ncbi:MAG: hypothetical protein GF398_11880 [Chitinivibrionales bacterium]|nr:hypothetical protein [Chitinivibrionales bacterium]